MKFQVDPIVSFWGIAIWKYMLYVAVDIKVNALVNGSYKSTIANTSPTSSKLIKARSFFYIVLLCTADFAIFSCGLFVIGMFLCNWFCNSGT